MQPRAAPLNIPGRSRLWKSAAGNAIDQPGTSETATGASRSGARRASHDATGP
nr:MAG TPA: hypothetical protein [Caudoviricetes sp.]